MDKTSENATHCFDAEGKGSYIEEEDILHIAGEDGSLDRCTDGYCFIRVNSTIRSLSKEVLDNFAYFGDAS